MKARSAFVAATMSILASSAWTADSVWQGGDGSWNDETKWNNGVPTASQTANVSNGGTIDFGSSIQDVDKIENININDTEKSLVLDASTGGGLKVATNFAWGDTSIGREGQANVTFNTGSYEYSDGSLAIGWWTWWHNDSTTVCTGVVNVVDANLSVANYIRTGVDLGYGELNVNGGGVSAKGITVADSGNSEGLVTIDGGVVNLTDNIYVGSGRAKYGIGEEVEESIRGKFTGKVADGKVELKSGSLNTVGFYVGREGGKGEVRVSGGTLAVTGRFDLGTIVDATEYESWAGGTGVVHQTAGAVTSSDYVAIGNGSDGTVKGGYGRYDISGGSFTTSGGNPVLVVGRVGEGEFNMSQADDNTPTTVSVASTIQIGEQQYAKGKMEISGGTLTSGGDLNVATGQDSEGTLKVSGGTITPAGAFRVGLGIDSKADVGISGGTIKPGGSFFVVNETGNTGIEATVTQTGGTIALESSGAFVGIGNASGGTGSYTISGGSISTFNNAIVVGRSSGSEGVMTISGTAVVETGAETSRSDLILCENDNTVGTLNLNGGTLRTNRIRSGDKSGTTATINCNGGTIYGCDGGDLVSNNSDTTIMVKAGGLVVEVPEGKEEVIYTSRLAADESLGGIVKKGKGTLKIQGTDENGGEQLDSNTLPVKGYIKVLEGTLQFWYSTRIKELDKLYVAEGAKLGLQYATSDVKVRSLQNNGTIDAWDTSITQMENPPALTKAVWTGARSDDVNDPANWALYYNDGTQDVRVSADELPTVDTTIYWDASIDDALPDLSALTYAKKVLVLPAETVTLTATSATTFEKTYNLSGWHLDASAATLNVVNAHMLGTAAVATAITSAGIDGRFANVTSDDGKGGVKVSYGNDGAVGVSRRGGFVIVFQ